MIRKLLALFLVLVLVIPTTMISVVAEENIIDTTENTLAVNDGVVIEEAVVGNVIESSDQDTIASAKDAVSVESTYVPATECTDVPERAATEEISDIVRTNEEVPALSAIGYTVDFVYNGILYSIDGGSEILLSELLAELKVGVEAYAVADISFTNYDYLDIVMSGNDWRIISLMPFFTEETLSLTLTDGTVIDIATYDSSPIVNEATGSYCVLYYMTQNDPSGNPVQGIYWYSNATSQYVPVCKWGVTAEDIENRPYEVICVTIEQALEWACLAFQHNGLAGIRIYITEMYHVPAGGEIWGQDYFSAHWPGYAFIPTQVLRAPGYNDEMIHIHTDFNKHLYAQNNVVIDNASAHCPDVENPVCIRVADGGLMIADGCIIMDTTIPADPVNKTNYKGTGVLLTTMDPADKVYPMVELNGGALELVGNTQIHHFAMAVDSDYGVTRLREPNPALGTWNIDNNKLSVNLAYGTYVGKWCDNISQINNVSIFLEDVELWKSGDIILASGYKSNPNPTLPDIKTPVVPTDSQKITIKNEMDLQYSMAVSYYGGITSDPYPVIRFELASIYNIQLNKWYYTLFEAVAASRPNDTLVFYASTNEGYTVHIPHNLTIRSSYIGEMPGGKSDVRAGSDCSATWNGNIFVNAVMVGSNSNPTNNMTVYFGTNDTSKNYGNLTFDTNFKCRHIENFGTAYLYNNFTLKRGNCEYGGSICSVGFTHLDGAQILDSTATFNGDGGAVAVSQGAFYFKSGLINGCVAGEGGAFFNNIGGTIEITGGTISNCTGTRGGAVYQHGTFYIGGKVTFTNNKAEDIYLPSAAMLDNDGNPNYVIKKLSDITLGGSAITFTLGENETNFFHGRNIVVPGNAAVLSSDLAKFVPTTNSVSDKNIFNYFNYVYTAKDKTNDNLEKTVLELKVPVGKIKITKQVDESDSEIDLDPNQAFIFDVVGVDTYNRNYRVTVVVYGEGTVVIGELPVGKYQITEQSGWSWRYGTSSVKVAVDNGAYVTSCTANVTVKESIESVVKYINTITKDQWFTDCAYASNSFDEV